MKRAIFQLYIIGAFALCRSVSAQSITEITWKGVRIYEFQSRSHPDTLEFCGGEYLVDVKATTMEELTSTELDLIVKKIKKNRCEIVFIDLKKYFLLESKQLYILGLKRK